MIQLILGILFGIVSAFYDKSKRFTQHIPRFFLRIIIVTIFAIVYAGTFYEYLFNFYKITVGFYIIFDYFLNILEGRKWNYIGNTAKTDILIKRHIGWKGLLGIKIFLLMLLLFIQKILINF